MLIQFNPPQFEFRNFIPPDSVAATANTTLAWLADILPEDALVNASLKRVGQQHLCKIDVVSSLGCFRSEVFDVSAEVAIDQAVLNVKERIREWRKVRLGLDGTSYVELMTH